MTLQTILLLAGAGFLGGAANAMAGGATLITFPAMMASGLAAIPANASNAVAVSFGNLMGAWADRSQLPALGRGLAAVLVAAVIGGLLGGMLLLATPEHLFVKVVPLLIGAATLIFAFSKKIQAWFAAHVPARHGDGLQASLVLPAAVYGGYFGAGLGVVLLAVLSATSTWELRRTNAAKNLLSVLANFAAIAFFVVQGVVSWPHTLVMLCGALAGGFAGVRALRILPAARVRQVIIGIGTAMTVVYAWRYWF